MPDVIILDLGLPDLDGISVIRQLRSLTKVPVVVLSARHESDDRVEALDEGADDYVTKPFGMEELLARVRVAVRRGGAADSPLVIESDGLVLDVTERRAMRDESDIHLTPTEWQIVRVLTRRSGRLVRQSELLMRYGGPRTSARPTICASTWPSFGASSRPIRAGPDTS